MKLEQEVLPNLKADEAMLGRGYFEYLTFFFFFTLSLHKTTSEEYNKTLIKDES